VFAIILVDLTPELCARLRSMCVAAGTRNRGGSYRNIERPTPAPGQPLGTLTPRRK
jgi:hypothetical protein